MAQGWISTTGAVSRARLDDMLVVDLDVHILEEPAEIAAYCDRSWRSVIEERQPVAPFGERLRLFPNFPGQWEPRRPVATTPETMRSDLDALSVDVGVLFPEYLLGLARQPNKDYAVAVAQAYNRWLLDRYVGHQVGFLGGIIVAPQNPETSADEIRRYAANDRVFGVVLPSSGVNPLWGDRRYDPIYQAAQECDLAVMYHAGGVLTLPMLPFHMEQFDTWFTQHTFSHSVAIMATLANLMATGVPTRFPRLRMVFIEAGISWVGHLMASLDRAYVERRADVAFLDHPPSYYMRRQMYFATQPVEEPEHLRDMAQLVRAFDGGANVVFASDYPHHDFDHPKKVHDIPLGDETKRRVMGENAVRLLGLPSTVARVRR